MSVCWLFFRHNQDEPLLVPLISCWSSSGVSPRAVCVVKSTVSSPEITEGSVTAANSWPQIDHVSILVMQIWGLSCFTGCKWKHPHLLHHLCLAYLISGLGWCDLFVKLDAFRKSNPSGRFSLAQRYRVNRMHGSLIDIQLWFSSVIAGLDAISRFRRVWFCEMHSSDFASWAENGLRSNLLPQHTSSELKRRRQDTSVFLLLCFFLWIYCFFSTLSWALF